MTVILHRIVRNLLLVSTVLSSFVGAASAATYFSYPPAGPLTGPEIMGPIRQNNTDVDTTVAKVATAAQVPSLAALKALTAGAFPSVYRTGYTTAGDGGDATYLWSATACSLNGGLGDNGLQVAPTTGTGCWIAQIGSKPPSILMWGADPTGVNNSSQPIAAACNDAAGRALYAPSGIYLLGTSETITTTCNLRGDGWSEAGGNASPATPPTTTQGTWFNVTNTSVTPFTFTGEGVVGSHWEKFGVLQGQYHHFGITGSITGGTLNVTSTNGVITSGQFVANNPMTISLGQVYITGQTSGPTGGAGTYTLNTPSGGSGNLTLWGETIFPPVFAITNTQGEVQFSDVMLFGVSKGFNVVNSQRFDVQHLRAQCFEYCIQMDAMYDVNRLDDVHIAPYWDSDNSVYSEMALNLNAIISLRNDSPQWGRIFCFGGHSCVELGLSSVVTSGVQTTTGGSIDSLVSDYAIYGLWIPGSVTPQQGPDMRIANAYFSGASPAPSDTGLQVDGANSILRFGNFRIYYENCNAISYTNTLGGNVLSIAALDMENIGLTPSVCPLTGAIQSQQATASGGVANKLKLLSEPTLQYSSNVPLVFGFASNVNNSQNYVNYDAPFVSPWSPVLAAQGGTSPSFTGTYSNQYGGWTTQGARVSLTFNTTFSASSSSGTPTVMTIGNLPFWSAAATSTSTPPQNSFGSCTISNASGVTFPTGTTQLTGVIAANANSIQIYAVGSGIAAVPVPPSNFASAFSISGTCAYNRY